MRILFTNNTLSRRAGTELYVRDVAVSLLKRGHTPIAYSQTLGQVADDLRAATVPVISDLRALHEPPDVIHGHHHVETMTAALYFPDVPVVSFCHGWLPWEEMPASAPNVVQYVAIDATTRDRLHNEHGIAPERITLISNFVDTDRFLSGPELPSKPRRALVFSNMASEATHLPAIRQACAERDIAVDAIGLHTRSEAVPEEFIKGFDLVFARGRSALESMATGRAVVLSDYTGLGPLVTSDAFDDLRALNFGIRTQRELNTPKAIGAQIDRYNAVDAAAVSGRVRREASLAKAVEALEKVYADAAKHTVTPGVVEVGRAASDYVRGLAPRAKSYGEAQRDAYGAAQAREAMRERLSDANLEIERLLCAERFHLERHAQYQSMVAELQSAITSLSEANDALRNGFAMRVRNTVVEAPVLGKILQRVGRRVLRRESR